MSTWSDEQAGPAEPMGLVAAAEALAAELNRHDVGSGLSPGLAQIPDGPWSNLVDWAATQPDAGDWVRGIVLDNNGRRIGVQWDWTLGEWASFDEPLPPRPPRPLPTPEAHSHPPTLAQELAGYDLDALIEWASHRACARCRAAFDEDGAVPKDGHPACARAMETGRVLTIVGSHLIGPRM